MYVPVSKISCCCCYINNNNLFVTSNTKRKKCTLNHKYIRKHYKIMTCDDDDLVIEVMGYPNVTI